MTQTAQPFVPSKSPRRNDGVGGWKTTALAPAFALLSCVLYSFNGELLQALQLHTSASEGHASPMLNLVLCHLGGLAFVPWILVRGPAAERAGRWPPTSSIASGSLLFAFLLMTYNYAWLQSARHIAAGVTNALFQSSVAMTFLASVALFREPSPLTSVIGVGLALAGPALASGLFSGSDPRAASTPLVGEGVVLALLAAMGYSAYQVLFRHVYSHLKSDVHFLAYFIACVSAWHLVVILPLTVLASAVGFEPLTFPHGKNAVIGTIASAVIASTVNGLYLCIVMWGSPMLLPCASALSVPSMVILDFMLHQVFPKPIEALGHLFVVLSVALIMGPQAFHWRLAALKSMKGKLAEYADVGTSDPINV